MTEKVINELRRTVFNPPDKSDTLTCVRWNLLYVDELHNIYTDQDGLLLTQVMSLTRAEQLLAAAKHNYPSHYENATKWIRGVYDRYDSKWNKLWPEWRKGTYK